MITLKKDLIIGVIGVPKSGKSTAIVMLGELFLESGNFNLEIVNLREKSLDDALKNSTTLLMHKIGGQSQKIVSWDYKPRILLIENIDEPQQACEIYNRGVLLRIRSDSSILHWSSRIPAQVFITQSNNFRLFKFQLKDTIESQIKNTKHYKEAIGI